MQHALTPGDRLLIEGVALIYLMVNVAAVHCCGGHYLLFPGFAALAYDVLVRPWGSWAGQPGRLVLTPALGATIGTWVTRMLPYHVATILLIVILCLLLLAVLRSDVSPAIAAGVLPLVLGWTSWWYPVSVAIGAIALVGIALPWRRRCRRRYRQGFDPTHIRSMHYGRRGSGSDTKWILPFFVFLTVMALAATGSNLRFILFPPLIVIGYEMYAHTTSCAWSARTVALLGACSLASTGGWLAVRVLGAGGVAAGCAMVFGMIVLRILNLHAAPVLAVGLLPLIIDSPTIQYPISVSIGTAALVLAFLPYRAFAGNRLSRRNGGMLSPDGAECFRT